MIKVATIINTHGLKGDCKLMLNTDDIKHRFKKGRILYLEDKTPLEVQTFRIQKGFGYCHFKEITSIEEAEKLKTKSLWIPKSELPTLEEGHYYYFEFMDCDVENDEGQYLGKVVDILETGANIVFRIQDATSSFLCPYVPTFIKSVDVDQKKIVIHEMEGLR